MNPSKGFLKSAVKDIAGFLNSKGKLEPPTLTELSFRTSFPKADIT